MPRNYIYQLHSHNTGRETSHWVLSTNPSNLSTEMATQIFPRLLYRRLLQLQSHLQTRDLHNKCVQVDFKRDTTLNLLFEVMLWSFFGISIQESTLCISVPLYYCWVWSHKLQRSFKHVQCRSQTDWNWSIPLTVHH